MNNKRILLIDDDEDDCFFFGTALEEFDTPVQFTYIRDSEAAVKQLCNDKDCIPDILFLDWNMPRLNGRECLFKIRSTPILADIPVIIYTTSQSQADKQEAKELGASYFLSKPPSIRQLRTELKNLISKDWKGF